MNCNHNKTTLTLRLLFVLAIAVMVVAIIAAFMRAGWQSALTVFAGEMAACAMMSALNELRHSGAVIELKEDKNHGTNDGE